MPDTPQTITPRDRDFSQWYLDVIREADLAENSPVRGSMIIKPYGYAIWETIQRQLDAEFKKAGIQNAYFPLLIPEKFIRKEAEHIKGFNPELAVVTHAGGKKLDEPMVLRPTSETIIYDAFSRWIESYRDLPLLINQWANVVRWELRPRLFLRTTEFLWQEGHTAHATLEEANAFALMVLQKIYQPFVRNHLAMAVISGQKTEAEKFAGALTTYSIEALMQDGKFLQAGTSHNLSDHFAKSFGVKYLAEDGKESYVYNTSWGVSTRLIGGLIMSHSDDKGLVLPPTIAPNKAVIVPITAGEKAVVLAEARRIAKNLPADYQTIVDDREQLRPGEKFYEWEKNGIPVRIEIGPKDLERGSAVVVRRDTGDKESVPVVNLKKTVATVLRDMQKGLLRRSESWLRGQMVAVETWEEFVAAIDGGKYVLAHWSGDPDVEAQIKDETKATIRSIPFDQKKEHGRCVKSGGPSSQRVVFGRAY